MKEVKKYLVLILISTGFTAQPQQVTFYEHVAPILYQHCTPCHSPGNIGPFPLIEYEDVKNHATTIGYVTQKRYMPPWDADNSYSHFSNVNVLSNAEIKTIQDWIKNGLKAGDKTKLQKKPLLFIGKELGKPDLILKMPSAIFLPADNKERFYQIKIPFELPEPKMVCHCEFVPGNKKVVHHMDAYLLTTSPYINVHQPPYFTEVKFKTFREVMQYMNMIGPDGKLPTTGEIAISDYFPGSMSVQFPKGIYRNFVMPKKGAFYIDKMHYGGSSKPETDQSYFKIYFCKEKVQRSVIGFTLGSPDGKITPPLSIPAETVKKFRAEEYLKADMSLLAVQAHMHLLGRKFKAYAISPKKDTIKILKINDWDFRWQRVYKFKNIVKIPAGSTIYAEAEYDNTSNNPYNPNSPPQQVNHSINTKDEMLQLWLYFLPYKPGDEKMDLEKL